MAQTRYTNILRRDTQEILFHSARWCDGTFCKLRGLQFRRGLDEGEGLILVGESDTVVRSSIHMFFVFFPIAAVWINTTGEVTHKTLARPWRPYYASHAPARYVLETAPDFLVHVAVGDQVDFQFLDGSN